MLTLGIIFGYFLFGFIFSSLIVSLQERITREKFISTNSGFCAAAVLWPFTIAILVFIGLCYTIELLYDPLKLFGPVLEKYRDWLSGEKRINSKKDIRA